MKRRMEIDIIRILSMIFIVLCHCLLEMGFAFGEYFNVGVVLFLLISGYLFGQKEINDYKGWLKKRLQRILPEYYIFIMIYFLVVCFTYSHLYVKSLIINIFALQGIFTKYSFPNAGHLWFVSYILFCYFITPLLQKLMNSRNTRDSMVILGLFFMVLQLLAIPLRTFGINIQVAYLASYIIGYYFSSFQCKTPYISEHDRINGLFKRLSLPSLFLELFRILADYNVIVIRGGTLISKFIGLLSQWINCLLGIWLFSLLYLLAERILIHFYCEQMYSFIRIAALP